MPRKVRAKYGPEDNPKIAFRYCNGEPVMRSETGATVPRPVPGKETGLLATRNIAVGEYIKCDVPFFITSSFLEAPGMSPAELEGRLALDASVFPDREGDIAYFRERMDSYADMVKRYGVPLCSLRSPEWSVHHNEVGLFHTFCYLNHACVPNANISYNRSENRAYLYAIKPIVEDEEITISYLSDLAVKKWNMKDIQWALRSTYGFICVCPMHDLAKQAWRAPHDNLLTVSIYYDYLAQMKDAKPSMLLHCVKFIAFTYSTAGITDIRSARIMEVVLSIACRNGDGSRAKVFAENAMRRYRVLEGENSEKTKEMKAIMENAGVHKDWKAGVAWETRAGDVPTGLDQMDFNSWLWMTGKWADGSGSTDSAST